MLQVRLFEHMIYVNRHLQVETGFFGRASLAESVFVGGAVLIGVRLRRRYAPRRLKRCWGNYSVLPMRSMVIARSVATACPDFRGSNLPGNLPTPRASPFYVHPLSFTKPAPGTLP